MAGNERKRMRGECGTHRFRLAHDVMIAGRQFDILGRENLQIIIDHREQLEAEIELRSAVMQLPEGAAGAGRRTPPRFEHWPATW